MSFRSRLTYLFITMPTFHLSIDKATTAQTRLFSPNFIYLSISNKVVIELAE